VSNDYRVLSHFLVGKRTEPLLPSKRSEMHGGRHMISNIVVGVMAVLALAAGIWGWWYERHGSDE